MEGSIVVALLSLIGTLVGTLSGILVANKLVNYRLEQLEKKVQAHNNLIDRTYKLEDKVNILENDVEHLVETLK